MPLVDLSHPIEHGMTTYPGLPGPRIGDFLSHEDSRPHYAGDTTFQIGRIDLVASTGTYVDAPFHRYADGADLARLPLESLADLPARVVEARDGERALGPERFEGFELTGLAVLVRSGWSRHWRTPAYERRHPFLTAGAAELLRDRGAACVGIDSLNIDDTEDPRRPVHSILLAAGIPIAEHLTGLEALPDEGFRFHAVPIPVRGMGSFPVRAYAVVP